MGNCFITRRGGGGSGGLNFEVVGGTTQPTAPKENTFWVNTSTEITSWVFSPNEPETPAEGMVWINDESFGALQLNALKKNEIKLYPTQAKQYIGGTWTAKNASVYQNSQWKDLSAYLFNLGGQAEFAANWASVVKQFDSSVSASGAPATIAYSDDGSVTIRSNSGGSFTYYTKMIDLTNYKTLSFTGTVYGWGNWSWIGVYSSMPSVAQGDGTLKASKRFTDEVLVTGTYTIDVSALTGKHYIGFIMYDPDATKKPYFKMNSMKLE